MNFELSAEQKALIRSILEFASSELNQGLYRNDHESIFPMDSWTKCSRMGYLGFLIPAKYGGIGQDLLTSVLCMEALAFGCKDAGLVHAIVTQLCCGLQISLFGDREQKKTFLRKIANGQLICAQAITEPDAGSDISLMRTTAEEFEDHYKLNGTKLYISNAPIADMITIFAITNTEGLIINKLSCFIVEKGIKGFSCDRPLEKMGLRTLQNGEVVLNGCCVNKEKVLGKKGQGMFIFNEIIEWERIIMAACHLGTMKRIYKACLDYAKLRRQFGKPIGSNQSISNKIAEMRSAIELGRQILYKSSWLKDNKKRATLEISIAKLFISENLKKTCLESIQIHGAYGYMTEAEIERDFRDSVASTIYSGTSEIQRNIISKLSGL